MDTKYNDCLIACKCQIVFTVSGQKSEKFRPSRMIALDILIQPAICQKLFEIGLSQVDLGNLMSTCHAFSATRKFMFLEVFRLKLSCRNDYVKMRDAGARRISIADNYDSESEEDEKKSDIDWSWPDHMDFKGAEKDILELVNNYFNKPILSFGNLLKFEFEEFNLPIISFAKLTHFKCKSFNQPIQSFGNLKYFNCEEFTQPVNDFGNLEWFESDFFNHPVDFLLLEF